MLAARRAMALATCQLLVSDLDHAQRLRTSTSCILAGPLSPPAVPLLPLEAYLEVKRGSCSLGCQLSVCSWAAAEQAPPDVSCLLHMRGPSLQINWRIDSRGLLRARVPPSQPPSRHTRRWERLHVACLSHESDWLRKRAHKQANTCVTKSTGPECCVNCTSVALTMIMSLATALGHGAWPWPLSMASALRSGP